MTRAFPLFGAEHLALLFGTFALPALLAWLARARGQLTGDVIRYALASLLAANVILSVWMGVVWRDGFPMRESLPMHMCDWAMIATLVALLTRKQRAFELAYFWGLAGTFQGILTPDLIAGLPVLRYLTFFIAHCGIVIAVLYLTWGLGIRAERGAIWRVFGWTQIYVLTAAIVDLLTGGNYGYLRAKPMGASILDYLGPWPIYLVVLELIALILYFILYLPFYLSQRARGQAPTESPAS